MSATGSETGRGAGYGAANGAEWGATLIEMLVVVGILGLVTALLFPTWTSPLRRMQLDEARAALVANLRIARADALRGGTPVSLEPTEDGRGYAWARARTFLPAPVGISGDPGSITFFADGSSTGGALKLFERERAVSVEVDPGTGLVTAPAG